MNNDQNQQNMDAGGEEGGAGFSGLFDNQLIRDQSANLRDEPAGVDITIEG